MRLRNIVIAGVSALVLVAGETGAGAASAPARSVPDPAQAPPRPSSGASAWSVVPTPNPKGSLVDGLSWVSCTSAKFCIAVGDSTTSSTAVVTLAERWNGTAWSVVPTPHPKGSTRSVLSGVSCTSVTFCIAIGASSLGPLAERWNGKTWAIQAIPKQGALSRISCPSAWACIAVGNSDGSTLAERWNGTTWAIQATPNRGPLSGVSCTSASACTAVGLYVNSAGDVLTLAERWNGKTWGVQATPNPPADGNLPYSALNGVSCTSASACTAVGYSDNNSLGYPLPLAERWNGATWAIQATPNLSDLNDGMLNGVSCTSASACTAIGYYGQDPTGGDFEGTLAEGWNGKTWAMQSIPSPSGGSDGQSELFGVSCTSAAACTAVGDYYPNRSTGPNPASLAERHS
jgi:hypothetical protein